MFVLKGTSEHSLSQLGSSSGCLILDPTLWPLVPLSCFTWLCSASVWAREMRCKSNITCHLTLLQASHPKNATVVGGWNWEWIKTSPAPVQEGLDAVSSWLFSTSTARPRCYLVLIQLFARPWWKGSVKKKYRPTNPPQILFFFQRDQGCF